MVGRNISGWLCRQNVSFNAKNSPMQKNLCMGDVFINDKNYFLVVTLFEADQAP